MPQPPNILLICTDQHRHDFLGYRGASWLPTPNIDAIARSGAVFNNCFTNSPICGPARCALAAGKQPYRIGCLDNGAFLPLSQPTFYQRLRDHGYWTGYTGKLDLAKPKTELRHPRQDGRYPEEVSLGFCEPLASAAGMNGVSGEYDLFGQYLKSKGLLEAFNEDRRARRPGKGINCVSNFSRGRTDLRVEPMPEGWFERACADSPLAVEDHADAFIADKARQWLGGVDAQAPWFFQVNFFGPHDPFDPPSEYAQRFAEADVPEPIPADYTGKPDYVGKRHITGDPERIRYSRRQYSASIAHLDYQIGRILDILAERGMRENTLIVFTADHGEMLGDFGLYIKHVPYEASIRVPLTISGPGVPQGLVSDALVEWIDLNPTLCDLAGVPVLENIDGRSLRPVLDDRSGAHRESILTAEKHFRCLRTERWKYIDNHNAREELYDLAEDPAELHNLADDPACGETRAAMRSALSKRWTEGAWLR